MMSVPSSLCSSIKFKPEYEPEAILISLGRVKALFSVSMAICELIGWRLTKISSLGSSNLTEYMNEDPLPTRSVQKPLHFVHQISHGAMNILARIPPMPSSSGPHSREQTASIAYTLPCTIASTMGLPCTSTLRRLPSLRSFRFATF
jgi:hypothetical protein